MLQFHPFDDTRRASAEGLHSMTATVLRTGDHILFQGDSITDAGRGAPPGIELAAARQQHQHAARGQTPRARRRNHPVEPVPRHLPHRSDGREEQIERLFAMRREDELPQDVRLAAHRLFHPARDGVAPREKVGAGEDRGAAVRRAPGLKALDAFREEVGQAAAHKTPSR